MNTLAMLFGSCWTTAHLMREQEIARVASQLRIEGRLDAEQAASVARKMRSGAS